MVKNLDKFSKEVKRAYLAAIKEVAKLGVQLSLDAKGEFHFSANPAIKKKVDAIIEKLYFDVQSVTVTGINSAWDQAVKENNAITLSLFGQELSKLPNSYKTKILSNNAAALQNFVERKIKGLGLSDRIWKNTQQFRQDLEYALELGIGKGQSAASLATEIKKYLNDPNKLFRRVRNKVTGKLEMSRAAKDYHPGQGKYRSSYQNAFRLTRNEINFSYEGSNHEKHKQQDFVGGIEIRVSPQHKRSDDKGGISCYDLQGKYPKDFDWTYKWHVNCKCTSLTVLKTREELREDTKKILAGEKPDTPSKNGVDDIPENFTEYVKANEKKWANWKNQPRFLDNNKGIIGKAPVPKVEPVIGNLPTNRVKAYTEKRKGYLNIIKNEDVIRKNKDFETAIVFDSNGNEVFRKKGKEKSVSFTDQETKLFKDKIFTHNHPSGNLKKGLGSIGQSFSINDIIFAMYADVKEVRAVTPKYTFVMLRPEKGWMDWKKAKTSAKLVHNSIKKELQNKISSSKSKDKTVSYANVSHWNLVWKKFCKKHDITYQKFKALE